MDKKGDGNGDDDHIQPSIFFIHSLVTMVMLSHHKHKNTHSIFIGKQIILVNQTKKNRTATTFKIINHNHHDEKNVNERSYHPNIVVCVCVCVNKPWMRLCLTNNCNIRTHTHIDDDEDQIKYLEKMTFFCSCC